MGRPPSEEKKVRVGFYFPEKLVEEIEDVIALYRLKKRKKLLRSEIVEEAVRKYLQELRKELENS
ncbi:hypothetical protein [Desulfurobacterium crinifex]|jgi:metal-responsive CopG/Arc/MetJ family transcriptional regulator